MKKTIEVVILIADVVVLIAGLTLMAHNVYHLLEGESSAAVSVAHFGSVSGNPHLVSLFLGIFMVMGSLLYLLKLYTRVTWTQLPSKAKKMWKREPTELGKEIQRLKKQQYKEE